MPNSQSSQASSENEKTDTVFSAGQDPGRVDDIVSSQPFPSDRYEPLRQIGTGAVSAVFLCKDRMLNKKVAVKTLRSLSHEQLVTFQNEAKTTARLNHPNIVRILDFGTAGGTHPYMVMDFISGFTLKQWIEQNGPFDPLVAAAIFIKVADALAYAHEQGVYHRDLQASNIIVKSAGQDPEIAVVDFGLAKTKEETLKPTIINGNTIVGTPSYMSPDQVYGRSYDSRSEVYSLGCILFEALTGQTPFVGATALETINMHARNQPPSLLEFVEENQITVKLEDTIAICLEKNPDDRFQTVNDFRRNLDEVVAAGSRTSGSDSAIGFPSVLAGRLPTQGESDEAAARRTTKKSLLEICTATLVAAGFLSAALAIIHHTLMRDESPGSTRISFDADSRESSKRATMIFKAYSDKHAKSVHAYIKGDDDPELTYIPQQKELKDVALDNSVKPLTSARLLLLKDLPELTSLGLGGSKIEAVDELLPQLPALENLRLVGDWIDDKVIASLSRLPKLKHLWIMRWTITEPSIRHIATLKNLEVLDITDSQLVVEDIQRLPPLPIRHLVLNDVVLSDDVIQYLKSFPNLHAISIKRSMRRAQLEAVIKNVQKDLPYCTIDWH